MIDNINELSSKEYQVPGWEPGNDPYKTGCYEGWRRYEGNPLIHVNDGIVADPCVIKVDGVYYMFVTWESQEKITSFTSKDGLHWSEPKMAMTTGFPFSPHVCLEWEQSVSKPCVIYMDGLFHMWYTAKIFEKEPFEPGKSFIAHAISEDGTKWEREGLPVLSPDYLWEQNSVMNPCVIWDEADNDYKMWFSGGDYDVPDAIGFATSKDGKNWEKYGNKPVFEHNSSLLWEREKVVPCQVFKHGTYYYMLYEGYEHVTNARLCLAKSKDGITWQRHPRNPIITGGMFQWWDCGYTTKASMLFENEKWTMWYTGHRDFEKNIGIMFHEGEDLGF